MDLPDSMSEPGEDGGGGALIPKTVKNLYSCVSCRRRKIKCNKTNPCSNCTKAHLECVFPPPRRSVRGVNAPDLELQAKVHRLEAIINSLKSAIGEKDAQLAQRESSPISSHHPSLPRTTQEMAGAQERASRSDESQDTIVVVPQASPHSEAGRLVKDEGRSIYIGSSLWSTLLAEVEDLRHLVQDETDYEEDDTSHISRGTSSTLDLPFSNSGIDLKTSYPHPENRQKLWNIFKASVDPVVKVLHLPTVEPQLMEWMSRDDMTGIPRNINALLFAVFFSAVSSLEDDICAELLGQDCQELVARYHASVQRALTEAGLLSTDDMMVLQSFIIYVAALRHHAPRRSWTLCALGFRLLQVLGAHRDGAALNLSAFDTEMSKRLSWQLCMLECCAAEDPGCDPTMLEIRSFDAPLPRNLDDSDLSVDMVNYPEDFTRWTDSTLLVMWADITHSWRLVFDDRREDTKTSKSFHAMSNMERRAFVNDCIRRVNERYIKPCSLLVPIQWVTATLARLLVLEFKLAACKAIENCHVLSQLEREEFFYDAVECIEASNKLQGDHRGRQWVWLFKSFTVWRPLAYVLTELEEKPLRRDGEKAWRAVEEAVVARWHSPHDRKGHQWGSMLNLMERAQLSRSSKLRQRRESFQHRSFLQSKPSTILAPPGFSSRLGNVTDLPPTEEVAASHAEQVVLPPSELYGVGRPYSNGLSFASSAITTDFIDHGLSMIDAPEGPDALFDFRDDGEEGMKWLQHTETLISGDASMDWGCSPRVHID